MKTLDVREAEGQLANLIAQANAGEIIVIKDGNKEATLYAARPVEPEFDSPELEAELLKAANGPFTPYLPEEMRAMCEQIAVERRAARAKK